MMHTRARQPGDPGHLAPMLMVLCWMVVILSTCTARAQSSGDVYQMSPMPDAVLSLPVFPTKADGDPDLTKALTICSKHTDGSSAGSGTELVWAFEPGFEACNKVLVRYHAIECARQEERERKELAERKAQSAPDRAWLNHYVEGLKP